MDAIVNEAKSRMGKAVDAFTDSLKKLRSGRANPAMLNGIQCDYYGDKIDLVDICSISMPEPRQLLVKPYDRNDLKSVASALAAANLGINPQVEADQVRLIIPPLTEDIRKGIAKDAKAKSEDAKVAVRNIRRDYMDMIKKDDSMSDDYKDRVQDDIQKEVDAAIKRIDDILAEKQKEIMSI